MVQPDGARADRAPSGGSLAARVRLLFELQRGGATPGFFRLCRCLGEELSETDRAAVVRALGQPWLRPGQLVYAGAVVDA